MKGYLFVQIAIADSFRRIPFTNCVAQRYKLTKSPIGTFTDNSAAVTLLGFELRRIAAIKAKANVTRIITGAVADTEVTLDSGAESGRRYFLAIPIWQEFTQGIQVRKGVVFYGKDAGKLTKRIRGKPTI